MAAYTNNIMKELKSKEGDNTSGLTNEDIMKKNIRA